MHKSLGILLFSVLFSLGGWIVTLETWADALQPVRMGGLIMIIGSVGAAWLAEPLIKPAQLLSRFKRAPLAKGSGPGRADHSPD
jgi:hypothetical protein